MTKTIPRCRFEGFAYFFGASGAATSSGTGDRDAAARREAGEDGKGTISVHDMARGKLHTQQAKWAFKEDTLLSAELNELRFRKSGRRYGRAQ